MGSKEQFPHGTDRSTVYDAFHQHCSHQRVNSEQFMQSVLKELHRPNIVTWIKAPNCDIHGFASAGHAAAVLDKDDIYTAIRRYNVHARPLESPNDSAIADDILFARWQFSWNGRCVPLYKFKWIDNGWIEQEYYAVVTPKDPNAVIDNQCKFTESLIEAVGAWTQRLNDEVYMYEDGEWRKDRSLFRAVAKASWGDVIVNPTMKRDLINDVESFFAAKETYAQYNVPWKRGVILYGPPGCGKTISIKALMNAVRQKDSGVSNLYVKSFKASGCQSDQASIRQIFVKARAVAPALLVFEDLDSLVTDELRSFFLNEVDGIEENNGILIIGSTNHLDRLDTSITKRPSRFDRKYHFKTPSQQERLLYCQYWQQKLQSTPGIDFTDEICQAVAEATDGLTFAYLKEIFVQALLLYASGRAEDTTSGEQDPSDEKESSENSKAEPTTALEANAFFQTLRQQIDTFVEEMKVDDPKATDDDASNEERSKDATRPEKSAAEGGV
jgi:transitional endoplasmic reticulum ATPase